MKNRLVRSPRHAASPPKSSAKARSISLQQAAVSAGVNVDVVIAFSASIRGPYTLLIFGHADSIFADRLAIGYTWEPNGQRNKPMPFQLSPTSCKECGYPLQSTYQDRRQASMPLHARVLLIGSLVLSALLIPTFFFG